MTTHRTAPTLLHVARRAGVSRTTVSMVLNGKGAVSDATRERVFDAARELGYRVNPLGRSLRSGSTYLVGVLLDPQSVTLVERTPQTLLARALLTLTQELSTNGAAVVMITPETRASLATLPLDVLFIFSTDPAMDIPQDFPFGVPVVRLSKPNPANDRATGYVYHDHFAMTHETLDHLAEQGARRIALVPRPRPDSAQQDSLAGYRDWCGQHGQAPVVIANEGSAESIRQAVAAAVIGGVDAIYSITGDANSVLEGVRLAGRSVPDDVLVVSGMTEGFLEELISPQVSVQWLQAVDNARRTARLLVDVMHDSQPRELRLSHQLIIRESSIRPRTHTERPGIDGRTLAGSGSR